MDKLYFKNILLYIPIIAIATLLTFFFHEMSHWLAYKFLGYDAGFTLNGAGVKDTSIKLPKLHRIITSGAGPLFTVIQATTFYYILKRKSSIFYYPFLFIPFIMRLGATWANQFKPNDEGRISLDLGLNLYVISFTVVLYLFFLNFKISRKNKYSFIFNLITFILSGLFLFLLVYFDSKYKIRFV